MIYRYLCSISKLHYFMRSRLNGNHPSTLSLNPYFAFAHYNKSIDYYDDPENHGLKASTMNPP